MGDDSKSLSAFPVIPPSDNAAGFPYLEPGMTLRDYFAVKAMQALIMNPKWNGSIVAVVEDACRIADLMMQERDK